MSPLNLIPGGPKAFVQLGSGAHDPQIKIEAPDGSCAWEGFPVALRACPFVGLIPSDPAPSYQTGTDGVGFGAGPFGLPSMPDALAYGVVEAVLSGYHLECRVTGSVIAGTAQIGVANGATGGASDPSATYYGGAFDTGWFDANSPDCAQASTTPGRGQALGFGVIYRPFSPLVGATLTGVILRLRWVTGGGSATYDPFQYFAIVYGPPAPLYLQQHLYDLIDALAGSGSSSPPSGFTNEIVVGDGHVNDAGIGTTTGHNSAWYSAQAFASTQKVSCCLAIKATTAGDATWLYARLRDASSSSVTGYALEVVHSSSTFNLYRIDAGSLTLLDSGSVLVSIDVGDRFALSCDGDQITAQYWNRDVMGLCYFEPWADIVTATDATYRAVEIAANVGYVGLGLDGNVQRVFNYKGGGFTDPMPGLYVYLETSSCGVLTKTYTNIKTAIDAASLGFTTTILGGHGADVAAPDRDVMAGADCSGGVNEKGGLPL